MREVHLKLKRLVSIWNTVHVLYVYISVYMVVMKLSAFVFLKLL